MDERSSPSSSVSAGPLAANGSNSGTKCRRYVVITPVRDEAPHIASTVSSMAAQTIVPLQWIVVDDGSTDGTAEILDGYAARHAWLTVVHRNDRGYRAAGSGVMEAFHAGYAVVDDAAWQFLVKLDGDLLFSPRYFEECFEQFDAEPELGIGGGTICQMEEGCTRVDSVGDPPFHVRGATKIYRRGCIDDIGLPVIAPGWDTIDEMKANLHGWTTRTFPGLELVQLKPTGAAAGRWSDAFKNGRANYMTGYHAAFMLAKCIKRTLQKPLSVEPVALLAGYWSGYIKRIPQVADAATIHYVRTQQLRRLLLRPSIYR